MNLLENIRLGLDSLLANKVRAFLTMLGIIIGIASVIGILTIGTAMSNSVNQSLNSFGGSNIFVFLNPKNESGGSFTDEDYITLDHVNDLKEKLGSKAKAVTFRMSGGYGQMKDKHNYANVDLEGVTSDNQYVNNLKMLKGRYISETDVNNVSNVAVVSDKLVNNLFNGDPAKAIGKNLVFTDAFEGNNESFKIVGVYRYEVQGGIFAGGNNGVSEKEMTTSAYIPHTVAHDLSGEEYLFYDIGVTAASAELVEQVQKMIEDYFEPIYAKNEVWKVQVESTKKVLEQVQSVTNNIRLAIAVIAGISLLVGGIGVMNIMLVSVTERTREIGVRKALGATNYDIRLQFIIESMIVCLIGGAIGVLIGGSFGYMAGIFLNSPTYPSIGSIIFSVGFSMSIGLFFGYYPANKAAKLNPIDALRYE